MILSYFLLLVFFFSSHGDHRALHVLTPSFPTRLSSNLVAAALDPDMRARIPAREPLARLPRGIERARGRAVEHGVADDRVILALERRADHRAHRDDPARQPLADIIVGVAEHFERDALAQERAQ